jgi:uncharacterized membrane protein
MAYTTKCLPDLHLVTINLSAPHGGACGADSHGQGGVRLSEENVLVITLDEAATASQALKTLSRLDSGDGFELRAATVVYRTRDGRIRIEDHVGDVEARQTLVERHPRLATLLTVLTGPLDTLLLGNSLVALAGAVIEPTPDELALEHLARAIPLRGTAIIADVVEHDPDVVNRGLAPFGARVTRRPLAQVYAEVGAANEAIAAAGTEARRVLRNTRPTQQ